MFVKKTSGRFSIRAEWKKIFPKLKRIHIAKQILLEYARDDEYDLEGYGSDKNSSRDSESELEPVDCPPGAIRWLNYDYLAGVDERAGIDCYIYAVFGGYDEDPYRDDRKSDPNDYYPKKPSPF